MKSRFLVLGAGFGGMELSTLLSEALGEKADVAVISPVKRVAAAVGEGSMSIAFVHQYLRDQAERSTPARSNVDGG